MEYTKEELEALLKAFQILKNHSADDRKSIGSVEKDIKEIYVNGVMQNLLEK